MKQLLVFIGKLDKEHEELTKIQIDNSLELGWKVEDIVLVTDFEWEYRGVKALVLKGNFDALDGNRSSKIPVINRLFDMGKVRDGDTYWFHDHDAFQLEPMEQPKINELGITNHGWSGKWNAGSFFFNRSSVDTFQQIYSSMLDNATNEQDALTSLIQNFQVTNYTLLNITYNLNIYHLEHNLKKAEKPLMVAHFHPHKPRHLELFRSILPQRLLTIFSNYGIK